MAVINYLSEKIILPISDFLIGHSIASKLEFLSESQWWTYEALVNYQEEKLRRLIEHSFATVPYYCDLFQKNNLKVSDIQTISDLGKIPILTKEIIRNEGVERFISKAVSKKDIIKNSSSGSTGEPLKYFSTKDAYSLKIASTLRGWYGFGYRLGDKFVKISNSPRSSLKKIQDILTRNYCIYFNSSKTNNIDNMIESIIAYKPKVLRAYNAPLSLIIKTAVKNNHSFPKLDAVTTTGSILHDDFRKEIEYCFQCEVFDSYSCEGGATVFECETHECYHSTMEYAITEVLDENENDINLGRLISTDLWNYAMPFIRYNTQDMVEVSNQSCSCGRNLLSIKKIYGRDSDILVTGDFRCITPLQISKFFTNLKDVEQYQVRQKEINEFVVYLVAEKSADKTVLEESIRRYWVEKIYSKAKLFIKFVDDIPMTSSGKRRYIIRDSHISLNI